MNRVILVGRLTKDPDLRYTPNGVAVATFTLAVNRAFANQQGEREADFINCVIWRKQAENVANYLKKGSLAGVDGRLQTRNYDGQDGKRVYVTEVLAESVQFLEPRMAVGSNVVHLISNHQELVSVTKALTHLVNLVIRVTKVTKVTKVTLDLRRMTIHFQM